MVIGICGIFNWPHALFSIILFYLKYILGYFFKRVKTRGMENEREKRKIVGVYTWLEEWKIAERIVFSPGPLLVKREFSLQIMEKVGLIYEITHLPLPLFPFFIFKL